MKFSLHPLFFKVRNKKERSRHPLRLSGGVLVVDFFSKSRIMDFRKALTSQSLDHLSNEWRMAVSGGNREMACGGFLLS